MAYAYAETIAVIAFNYALFYFLKSWIRWVSFAAGTAVLLLLLASIYDNLSSGCFGAPKDVEFKQGMTICPGQTAHGTITLPDTTSATR